MSLHLPWAVAFTAERIERGVNKVVGRGEITFLAKTKGKEANTERGKRVEARGDSQQGQIITHNFQTPYTNTFGFEIKIWMWYKSSEFQLLCPGIYIQMRQTI